MYAVTGATGNTGRVVAEALLAAGKDVTVIGRSEERLKPLVDKGAEAFVGSVEEPQAMTLAFSGAVGVYCMLPNRYNARDFRAYQRTVGDSFMSAIHEAGVENVVFLSSMGAHLPEGTGPIAGLRKQEQRLEGLENVNVLSLRPGWFMENFYFSIDMIRGMGIVGTPVVGDVPMPMIATRDIGVYAAERLIALDFEGKTTRELLGERDVALDEAAQAIGAAIGMDNLQYVQFSFEDFTQAALGMGMSESVVSTFSEMYGALNDGKVVHEEERSAANTTPTTIEMFAATCAQAYSAAGT
jgi:uncharacterized protein YbjT (DUF2867 family)